MSVLPINLNAADTARFWSKVDRRGPDDCWLWTEGSRKGGYGHFHDCSYVQYSAHRVAFAVTNGNTELKVCHTCNKPACCNPAHLYAGTQRKNVQQCHAEGRAADQRGENNGYVKLTEDDVCEIRRLRNDGWLQREIADIYGISRSHVSDICTGKLWKHV